MSPHRIAQSDPPCDRPMHCPASSKSSASGNRIRRAGRSRLLPGEYYVTRNDEAITTVLGSCVSACIRDPQAQIGGMNHFMLPEDLSFNDDRPADAFERQATRYGSYAMESLINDLLKLGAARERLEIKLFGGGRMLASMTDIGARNIAFIKQYLSLEGFASPRRTWAAIGPARWSISRRPAACACETLRPIENRSIATASSFTLRRPRAACSDGGDIELFA